MSHFVVHFVEFYKVMNDCQCQFTKKEELDDSSLCGDPLSLSPSDDFIDNSLLLETALSQVNTSGFDAFVTHKVCQ